MLRANASRGSIIGEPGEPLTDEGAGSFFFQAEDGIRDIGVTGVQTCALPISCTDTLRSALLYCPRCRCQRYIDCVQPIATVHSTSRQGACGKRTHVCLAHYRE